MLAIIMSYLPIAIGIILALPALCLALIAFAMAVPGDQPEKFLKEKALPLLQSAADLVAKFSRK